MKTTFKRRKIPIFVTDKNGCLAALLACLLLAACAVQEDLSAKTDLPENVSNADARHFLSVLDKQVAEREQFRDMLAGKKPFYEMTNLLSSSTHGLCYVIPFGDIDGSKVTGAVYYPIANESLDGDRARLLDRLLTPQYVDGDVLNHEIPITERFLYSSQFNQLRIKHGIAVDDSLETGMALADTIVPIRNDGETVGMTAIPSSGLIIYIDYIARYWNNTSEEGIVVYALPSSTVINAIKKVMKSSGYNPDYCIFTSIPSSNSSEGSITVSVVGDHDIEDQELNILMWYLKMELDTTNRSVFLQWRKFVTNNLIFPIGGGTTGGIGGGGSSGGGTGSGGDSPQPSDIYEPVNDCDNIPSAATLKIYTQEQIGKVLQTQSQTIGGIQYTTIDSYFNKVDNGDYLEYSTTYRILPQAKNGHVITPINEGNAHDVDIQYNKNDEILFHNHGTQMPHSAQDLYMLVKFGMKGDSNLKASVVYCSQQKACYALVITNRSKLPEFYKQICDHIAGNGGFDQKFTDDVDAELCHATTLSGDNRSIYRIATVLEKYDSGIQLMKIDLSDKSSQKLTMYRSNPQYSDNNYEPIKCEDQ